jgi:hypothetical protein
METKDTSPICSTYVHVALATRMSHAVDVSSFGASASLRIGEYGDHDVAIFVRTPEQLEKLAAEATAAARELRQAIDLREQIQRNGAS